MLESGSARKYMLYAIGEIALVVIGILIALQINNLNEERKAFKFENQLLIEMRTSIKHDREQIDLFLNKNEAHINSCQIILDHLEQNLPYHDSLPFWETNYWWQLNLRQTAFETAKAYGLQFIEDDSLRSLLTLIYENDVKFIDDLDNRMSLYQHSTVEPYLLELFTSIGTGSDMIPHDFESLRTDKKYKTILRTKMDKLSWFNMIVSGRKQRIEKLDRRIKEEINNR
ncbi:MAG: DUF6090 family protein [Saprospiraceae bacterium]|nr:DUF6090 family protein [Saprospiraceae bacterium]